MELATICCFKVGLGFWGFGSQGPIYIYICVHIIQGSRKPVGTVAVAFSQLTPLLFGILRLRV